MNAFKCQLSEGLSSSRQMSNKMILNKPTLNDRQEIKAIQKMTTFETILLLFENEKATVSSVTFVRNDD